MPITFSPFLSKPVIFIFAALTMCSLGEYFNLFSYSHAFSGFVYIFSSFINGFLAYIYREKSWIVNILIFLVSFFLMVLAANSNLVDFSSLQSFLCESHDDCLENVCMGGRSKFCF